MVSKIQKNMRLRNILEAYIFHRAADRLCIPAAASSVPLDVLKPGVNLIQLLINKEIYFAKPLKMSEPGAGRKLRNKNRVKIIVEDAFILPLEIYI